MRESPERRGAKSFSVGGFFVALQLGLLAGVAAQGILVGLVGGRSRGRNGGLPGLLSSGARATEPSPRAGGGV